MTDRIESSVELTEGEAMPKVGLAATEPGNCPAKPSPRDRSAKTKSPAEWAYERLILYIDNFEKQLDRKQEVAMGFTGTDAGIIRIEGLGFFDPDIITFYGSDENGARTQLVQHVSQLNVILRAVPLLPSEEEPRRIGFNLTAALEKSASPKKRPARKT